jgi:hypothetical protein
MKLKGRRFETATDIERVSQAALDSIKENDFRGAFEAWEKQWYLYIHSQEDYFIGYDSKN